MTELKLAAEGLKTAVIDGVSAEVNVSLQRCIDLLQDADKDSEDEFMLSIFQLCKLNDVQKASYGITICGYLVELGFSSDSILEPMIMLFDDLIEQSMPFYAIFAKELAELPEDGDESELLNTLFNNDLLVSDQEREAINSINNFYYAAVSIFSTNVHNHGCAKAQLGNKVSVIARYNEGAYWLNCLLRVLFDQFIVVIDIDRNIGFEGRMSGVTTNYQLQHLLMSMPELNDEIVVTDEQLQTLTGDGIQILDSTLVNKWNMYTHTLIEQEGWKMLMDTDNPMLGVDFRESWIWSEGDPMEIPSQNGIRMILLGKTSYERSSRVQRNFKNLKACITIDKILTSTDINAYLNL